MKKRLRVEYSGDDGWTQWVQPIKRGYKMACCDCGLVHILDFRIVDGRVQFRARRAPRYTAQQRKKMKVRHVG